MRKNGFFTLLMLLLVWILVLNIALLVNWNRIQENYVPVSEIHTIHRQGERSGQPKVKDDPQENDISKINATKTDATRIRILLTDSDHSTCYHPFVTVKTDSEEKTYTVEDPKLSEAPLVLENGKEGICIPSIERHDMWAYSGTVTLKKTDKGILVINELPLEEYLEAVVPGEMPASYEMEALMAQAVCARTYAVKQMEEGRLREEFGADVDDSVGYQVYHDQALQERSSRAVRETKGQMIRQNGELINAYYFSTSSGQTSTDEIWGADHAASYLKSIECDYDGDMPWSRWEVTLPWEKLQSHLGRLPGTGGSLKAVQAVRKSGSGAVTRLEVITEEGTAEIDGEYEIRSFLAPEGEIITEKDGTEVPGGSLLPSAYFSMKVQPEEEICITGGGYGHGVGMSQNAANEMARQGYSWEEILHYFFKDIEITG